MSYSDIALSEIDWQEIDIRLNSLRGKIIQYVGKYWYDNFVVSFRRGQFFFDNGSKDSGVCVCNEKVYK